VGHVEGPSRLEYGTTPFETLVGITAAIDFMLEIGYDQVAAIEDELTSRLLAGLGTLSDVTVYGAHEVGRLRTSTVGFTVRGMHSDAVAERLASHDVAVWSGDFYAIELVKAMGLEATGGFVRAGVSVYNSAEDVDQLLRAVEKCIM
jgi:selenocysteine lyase/cysteine desulfurase